MLRIPHDQHFLLALTNDALQPGQPRHDRHERRRAIGILAWADLALPFAEVEGRRAVRALRADVAEHVVAVMAGECRRVISRGRYGQELELLRHRRLERLARRCELLVRLGLAVEQHFEELAAEPAA